MAKVTPFETTPRMNILEVSAGSIEYQDTGGSGPVLVLLHGLVMDGSVWRHVVDALRDEFRCIVPTLPVGAHRLPMRPDAELSPRSVARLVGELLERLDLDDVTLVENDHGHAQRLIGERPERIARLVLVACEAFDNYPPGLPGRLVWLAGHVPGGINALVQPLRWRALRRLPLAYGWLSKRPVPDAIADRWLRPLLTRRSIRHDLARYQRGVRTGDMLAAAEQLRGFDRPALVVWAAEDRLMPREHGRRLAELLPQGRLVELADSYTLLPEDQPAELAATIRQFVHATSGVATAARYTEN